jgi:predicted lactoylglutathione lyase
MASGRTPPIPTESLSRSEKGSAPHQAYACHWCFKARSRTMVDAFWASGLASGGSDDGAPGLRHYHPSYYAAFLRDPDGNRIEAVCHHAI